MPALITELFDRWAGKPILVIGGGPSVPGDLAKLREPPACVISANEHGTKQSLFPVDLIVNMDFIHCLKKEPMSKLLRPLGVPIANRFSWADYRLAEWPLAQNTGLAAIAVACALGGNPVIVTGLDLWTGGRRYFHTTNENPRDRARAKIHPAMIRRTNKERVKQLREFCKSAAIRPMSGPLVSVFPPYDPAEIFPALKPIKYRTLMEKVTPVHIVAPCVMRLRGQDLIKPGTEFVLTPREAEQLKTFRRLR